MRISSTVTLTFLLIPLIFLSGCDQQTGSSQADGSRIAYEANINDMTFGNYTIHINALTTDLLPAEVARGYKISRSKNQAILNVSVQEKQAEGLTSISASINVVAKNLSSQLKNVDLREIIESDPDAIYYIGELPVGHEETIIFDLDVTPAGATETILLAYSQKFYTE